MNVGTFLLVELLVVLALLSIGGALVYRCRASGEWQPRGLRDAEEDAGVEVEWR